MPLTSVLPTEPTFEDNITDVPSEKNSFGWPKPIERETSPPFNMDRVPSGRAEGNLPVSVYSDYYKSQKGGQNGIDEDGFDYAEETYEQEKPSWLNNNKKVETYQISALEDRWRTDALMKHRDVPVFQANNSHSDDELNALLKVFTL